MRKVISYSLLLAAALAGALLVSAVLAQDDWPYAEAGGTYEVYEGDWVMLDASGSYGVNGVEPLYEWDLDNDGSFETSGFSVWFDASGRDGNESQVVNLKACVAIEDEDLCYLDLATVNILNSPPEVDAGPDVTIYSGETFSLSAFFSDPGIGDSHTATVNYDDGSGTVGASVFQDAGAGLVTGSRLFYSPGTRNVRVCVIDDDGDTGCDNLNVTVRPITVTIDIRPYFYPNTFNLETDTSLKVAVLSSAAFDATTLNPNTVALAGAHLHTTWLTDIYHDGRNDLVGNLVAPEMNITGTATSATLTGITYAGVHVTGTDSIDIVPPPALTTNWSSVYPIFYWSPVNGGICYQVQIDNDSDFSSPVQVATNVEGFYYNADPLPSGQYYWRVRVGGVCVNVVQGGWSAPRAFTVP